MASSERHSQELVGDLPRQLGNQRRRISTNRAHRVVVGLAAAAVSAAGIFHPYRRHRLGDRKETGAAACSRVLSRTTDCRLLSTPRMSARYSHAGLVYVK